MVLSFHLLEGRSLPSFSGTFDGLRVVEKLLGFDPCYSQLALRWLAVLALSERGMRPSRLTGLAVPANPLVAGLPRLEREIWRSYAIRHLSTRHGRAKQIRALESLPAGFAFKVPVFYGLTHESNSWCARSVFLCQVELE